MTGQPERVGGWSLVLDVKYKVDLVAVVVPVLTDHPHIRVEVAEEELREGLGQISQLTSAVIHLYHQFRITLIHGGSCKACSLQSHFIPIKK